MLMPEHPAFSKAVGTVLGKSCNSHSHCCPVYGQAGPGPEHSDSAVPISRVSELGLQLHTASAETFIQSTRVAKQATT